MIIKRNEKQTVCVINVSRATVLLTYLLTYLLNLLTYLLNLLHGTESFLRS